MGKTTFAISFYCRASKANRFGQSPVELSICLNGKRKFINLPIKYEASVFNRKRQPQEIVDCLSVWRQRINEYVDEIVRQGIPLTVDNLREVIQTGGIKTYTIKTLFDDYLSILRQRVPNTLTENVYRRYELVRNMFLEHIDGQKEVSAITNGAILSFYAKMNAKYDISTSAGYMTKLKSCIRFAIDNDRLKVNPFNGIKINKGKKDITYLTEEEIRLLLQAKMDNKSLQQVLDCFIVMCGTGLAYSDLKGLRKEDIMEQGDVHYIVKERQKTKGEYTSVIMPWAYERIEKYDGNLPVISNQKLNCYLHTIEVLLNLHKSLHSHLARKSYACLLLQRGVRMETVSKALGHSTTKITQQYYAKLTKDNVIDEVSSIF